TPYRVSHLTCICVIKLSVTRVLRSPAEVLWPAAVAPVDFHQKRKNCTAAQTISDRLDRART
ncbi:hypothetical protein SMMN14_02721, partial [Sphaerulina musiva]